MSKLKVGSLFAGYGGLSLAVEQRFDAELAALQRAGVTEDDLKGTNDDE